MDDRLLNDDLKQSDRLIYYVRQLRNLFLWRTEHHEHGLYILQRLFLIPVYALEIISPYTIVHHLVSRRKSLRPFRQLFSELYALAWTVLLSIGIVKIQDLCIDGGEGTLMWWVWVSLAAIRYVDLLGYFLATFVEPLDSGPIQLYNVQRSMVKGLFSLYDVVCAFGILYIGSQGIMNQNGTELHLAIDAFYFSMVTMFTIGYGDFSPRTSDAKMLVILQVFTSGVMLLLWLPNIASRVLSRESGITRTAMTSSEE